MKNKKWLMLGSVVGISGVVMAATGFSAMAGTSGYDTYKSALKNTKTATSVTVQASAQLSDNGSVLASANGTVKADIKDKTASGTATVKGSGGDQSLSFFKQTDSVIWKSGDKDVYYQEQEGKKRNGKPDKNEQEDKQIPQQVENVIDTLVGPLKSYVAVDGQADGTQTVSVELSGSQIPTLLNAVAPLAIKQATGHELKNGKSEQKDASEPKPFDEKALLPSPPQLTQDIKIEKIAVKATIDSANFIQHQEADLTVSGKDDQGNAHVLAVHLSADLSDFNKTSPETIDLTGKTVQQVQQKERGKYDHRD